MSIRITLFFVVITSIIATLLLAPPRALSQSSEPMLGYAWSDTVGWIDLNCANSGVCASHSFGLSVAPDGAVSGYAWSDNVGWVSANAADLSGCPSAPCTATLSSTKLSGWLKALSGGSAQSGGWDGFISVSGPSYGVTRAPGAPTFSGYAWGDMVIGWLTLSIPLLPPAPPECRPIFSCVGNAVHNSCTGADTPCRSGYTCSAGACLPPAPPPSPVATIRVSPALVRSGATTQVTWSSSHVSSCRVFENNSHINDAWTGAADTKTSSPITQQTTYTLSCTGTDGSTLTQSATVRIVGIWKEK